MNHIEKKYFEELHKDRADSADTFEKPSTREMWRSIVEKYSDQAHFIYELIQNADDAGAKAARFVLEKDRLIFAHNGTRHFSISNPESEDSDSKVEGKLGDINSITGIAFSNKKTQGNKIGKFGVGFKAVFQYTATPHIYDPEFRFRIDRYIVPTELIEDFQGRKSEETLFVFPFDHKDRNPLDTYRDIESKLKTLSYPILFLTNLLEISFEINGLKGIYEKEIIDNVDFGDTTAEKICLKQVVGTEKLFKSMWLFSRYDNDLRYSVGFFLNEEEKLVPGNEPAFCFFPTKENTGLKFLLHAPFLLTDSREGIRAGISHNNHLIELLADLAGDSLLYLRDIGIKKSKRLITDDILTIIPIDEDDFCELDDTSRISFLPFYTKIKDVFENEKIIPTAEGYINTENAYWAAVPYLAQLFSGVQLAKICGNVCAQWAFPSLGRNELQRSNRKLYMYIDSIVNTNLDEDDLLKGRYKGYSYYRTKEIEGIDEDFIEKQDVVWLHKFYKWLSETSNRTEMSKRVPIFLDQDSKAISPYNEDGQLILFLPAEDIIGYRTVRDDLLKNDETRIFVEKLGITHPSIKNQIYNKILPLYDDEDADIDTDSHFLMFFKYYKQCPQEEVDDFVDLVRDCKFVSYYQIGDGKAYRGKANDLYFPDDELSRYFLSKPSTKFLNFEDYLAIVGKNNERQLRDFFVDLGVLQYPRIIKNEYSRRNYRESVSYIDGLQELIKDVVQTESKEKSLLLWNVLYQFVEKNMFTWDVKNKQIFSRPDARYSFRTSYEKSETIIQLQNAEWILDSDEQFVSPTNITKDALSDMYDLGKEEIAELLSILEIKEVDDEEDDDDDTYLSEKQKEQIGFAKKCNELGLTEEDLEEMAEIKRKRALLQERDNASRGVPTSITDTDIEKEVFEELDKDVSSSDTKETRNKINKATSRVAKDIIKRTNSFPSLYDDSPIEDSEDIDSDEYIPSPVDFSRKAEQEKQKAARAIDKIAYQEELQQRALESERYTYGWFKALLELEALNSNANNLNSKEISISFAKVEREPGTQRTLVLKQPNRYIPQFIEDLADIPLVVRMGEKTKTLAIEVANVKSYTLRVKLKSHVNIEDLDLSEITEARIDAKSPVFLLEELRKQFLEFDYDDTFNMQQNLCKDIEFVFGPPGTGKTTYLAKNVLIPMMDNKDNYKVLVLAPTNKAADVLVRRIMEVKGDDNSYNDWLIRFGGTGDEVIEQSPVYKDKTFDIRTLNKNVTVTTIARFPYDFFMPQGSRIFLNGINWDYIVIDEASMIPLVNIIYPLYKKTPKKFVIAGDPFQIEPITSVDLWKNENIYTMVRLDSFVEPHTIPYEYKVELLTTQYRSVPSVGAIFSKFTYGGILEHYRTEESRRNLNIDDVMNIESLNIIKFPVSKYESIYRAKRLQHSSSYQVYSALFVYEFVSYLSRVLAKANYNQSYRIGVIAPYRAQADLIEKLLNSADMPKEIDVQVGTIHGFQGDECDIIFAVFNTPPTISSGKDMFLNKRNIVNVAISRAKDYLFVVMPDDDTENINNLRLVKRVEQLFKSSQVYTEYQSQDLEQQMFDCNTYLEDNAFSTGHQSVNVYGLPEKKYEIRSEDSAVDIQIHNLLMSGMNHDRKVSINKKAESAESQKFFWLKEKTKVCPLDSGRLITQAVSVTRKDGKEKRIHMLVCPECGEKYIVAGTLPESIDISQYNVVGRNLG